MQPDVKKQFGNYKRVALVIAILFIPMLGFSKTKTGSIEFLKSCNGFNGIKLGQDISEIQPYKLAFMDGNSQLDADSCVSYVFQDDSVLKVDSDFNLQQVAIRTYKNKIVNIYLFFKMTDSYKALRDFLKDYGQFNELPKEYAAIYNWNTSSVNLSLKYEAKTDYGIAVFTCNELQRDIETMKESQKVFENFTQSFASAPVYNNQSQPGDTQTAK
jgi:hypothetical protein